MLSPSCPMHQKGTFFSLQKGSIRHALSNPLMTKCIGTNIPTLKELCQSLIAGNIADLSGLDRKEVDAAMKQLKAEGAIVSPVRCKWAPAE